MGIGVTVARLTLDQLVKVRILDPQFLFTFDRTFERIGEPRNRFDSALAPTFVN